MREIALAIIILLAATQSAEAYIGPGMAGGVIATVFGILGSVFLAIFAIVWYPLKRMWKRLRGAAAQSELPDTVADAPPNHDT